MTKPTRLLCCLLASLALPCVAAAQNPQPAPPQEVHPPLAPPNASQPPPEQIAPSDGNLSEKLSRQQGMLQPNVVDPGIRAPLPPRMSDPMAVIPPPGTRGGDQKVVPQ
jgi:hypothetical protein